MIKFYKFGTLEIYSIPFPDDRARAPTCSQGVAQTPPALPPSPAPATLAVSVQTRPYRLFLFIQLSETQNQSVKSL